MEQQLNDLYEKLEECITMIQYPDTDDIEYNLNLVQSTLLEFIEEQRKQNVSK